MGFTATDVAQLTGIRRKAVTVIFLKVRRRIAKGCGAGVEEGAP